MDIKDILGLLGCVGLAVLAWFLAEYVAVGIDIAILIGTVSFGLYEAIRGLNDLNGNIDDLSKAVSARPVIRP